MNNVTVLESSYSPRPLSLEFHARHQRFSVVVAHRRFGKTVMCVNDLIDKAIQNTLPMPRYGYIAPLYKQAKDIAWNYLKMYAEPITDKVMESELSVLLKNGATVRLYGADNPDSLRGVYFDGVILDEYGDMSPRLFGEVIAPTLADRKGWAVFIGTPKGPNHFYEIWQKASLPGSGWFTKMFRASETGIIDREELDMLANMPGSDEDTFRQEFEVDFNAAIRGAYYGKLLNELEGKGNMGHFPWDPNLPVITSWDLGYSDDTSVWFFQTNGREFKMIDFFSVSGFSVDDVMDKMRSYPYAYGLGYLPHDAKNKSFQTGKSIRELMWEQKFRTQLVPNLSVQDGIQAVRKTLPSVYFNTSNPNVVQGLNALRVYQREWDDRARMFKEKPKHDWASNPADAFRMFALAMNPSAARRASTGAVQAPKSPAGGNVMTLESLFRDRENSMARNRRI